jgi:MFS family permease
VPSRRVVTRPACLRICRCADAVVRLRPVTVASALTGRSAWASKSSSSRRFPLPRALPTRANWPNPSWRARAVGVYRLWRDGGFAIGPLVAGILADAYSIRAATWTIAALTAASGFVVATRM